MAGYYKLKDLNTVVRQEGDTAYLYNRETRQWEADTEGRFQSRFNSGEQCEPVTAQQAEEFTGIQTIDMRGGTDMYGGAAVDMPAAVDMGGAGGVDMGGAGGVDMGGTGGADMGGTGGANMGGTGGADMGGTGGADMGGTGVPGMGSAVPPQKKKETENEDDVVLL